MKNPTSSGKHRRSKHFSHWNIYICHTVFKICLFPDIFQFMQMNDQICLVVLFSFYFYPLTGIQSLNDRLLYPFILFIIQCIDLHNLCKNLRKIISDLRHRIGNDRKASLIAPDVTIYDLTGFVIQLYLHFLLCLV